MSEQEMDEEIEAENIDDDCDDFGDEDEIDY